MPHRNIHRHTVGTGKADTNKGSADRPRENEDKTTSEKMSHEFPTYEALDDEHPVGGSYHGEHRADAARMSHRMNRMQKPAAEYGGTSAKRSRDDSSGPVRGESTGGRGAELLEDQPARGEDGSVASDNALWDEASLPSRGESGSSSDADLTWSGFAEPARGESSGPETNVEGIADTSAPTGRGESAVRADGTASGGFMEPDPHTSPSDRNW